VRRFSAPFLGAAPAGSSGHVARPHDRRALVAPYRLWLYLWFTLSYQDVEDLLAERGLTVSNESIRRWVLKFGPVIAKNLRGTRPKPHSRWHLDEMVVSIAGRQMYMWRAVGATADFR